MTSSDLQPEALTYEAIYLLDPAAIIRFATPNAVRYYGYAVDEVIGQSVFHFMPPHEVQQARERWNAFIHNPNQLVEHLPVTVISAAGLPIHVRVSVWRLPDSDNFMLIHHAAEQVRDRLKTLYSMMAAVAESLGVDELLDIVLHEIRRLIPCHACTTYIFHPNNRVQVKRSIDAQVENYQFSAEQQQPEFEIRQIIRTTGKPVLIHDCPTDPRWVEVAGRRPIRSWLGVPLIHEDEFMGELDLDSPTAYAFSDADAELALALAAQVAARLHSARRYEQEIQRAQRFQALNEVNLAISRLDLRSVLEVVYLKISALMDTTSFYIGLYDSEAGVIRIVGGYDDGQPTEDKVQPADAGLAGLVLRTCESVFIHDTTKEALPKETIVDGPMPRCVLMVPLITQDQILGVISVQSYMPNAYSPDDIAMLETIAGMVATAIQNAQLYNETAGRLAAIEALQRIGVKLAAVQTREAVAEIVARAAVDLFHPNQVRLYITANHTWDATLWIAHYTSELGKPRIRSYEHPPVDSLVERVQATQLPMILTDLSGHSEIQTEFKTPWLVHAAIAHPILRGDQLLGVLILLHAEPLVARRDMLRALDLLALQAAAALENARYYVTLRTRLDEVSGLQELARWVSSTQSSDDILKLSVDTLRDVYQCRSASIALVDAELQEVVTVAASGLEQQYIDQARFKLGEYVAGKVAETGEVIYVPDTAADPNFRVVDPAIRSMISVPLKVQDRVIGTVGIDSQVPFALTPDHERVLVIAAGQIAAAIETIRLLEETRHHAADLAEANRSLEALHELRNELVSNLSHELRSPLALVRGWAGLMKAEELGPLTAEQSEALAVIDQKADSITRMISDILALEQIRADNLDLVPLDINDLCAKVIAGAPLVFPNRDLHFETSLLPGPHWIQGDQDRLTQVLDNLIGNAAKFSPDGGTVLLQSAYGDRPDWIYVSITDYGIGIPTDKLPHIFERFFQADRSIKHRFGGAGLGLSIVQRIIDAHGGTLSVESQEGKGSTFTFGLPLSERE
ncbi:MAG TPA: GAF domain-containing protein [Aggregatilineaceae bacterium]|nr:GAF domain-containing protein [Aggregatilineaceae bacterium]